MPAPDPQYRDVLWIGEGPNAEERKQAFAPSGVSFSLGTFGCCTGMYECRGSAGCAERLTSKRKYPDRGSGTAITFSISTMRRQALEATGGSTTHKFISYID
jgi:hypothetical protein